MRLINFSKGTISTNWEKTYYSKGKWVPVYLTTKLSSEEVFKLILEIENQNPPDLYDQINKIIGNATWTSHFCYECGKTSRDAMVGFDINRGEYEYIICIDCLNYARELLITEKSK